MDIYSCVINTTVYVLNMGDKTTQQDDIDRSKTIVEKIKRDLELRESEGIMKNKTKKFTNVDDLVADLLGREAAKPFVKGMQAHRQATATISQLVLNRVKQGLTQREVARLRAELAAAVEQCGDGCCCC